MLSLGGGGAKSAKPSFVSYVTPEEIKPEKESQKKEKHPDLLPGEVVFCSASPVLRHTQDDVSQRGIFGTLLCTNFRVSFISDETPLEETTQHFRNKLYGENDIPLMCVDHVYGVYDEKKKLITGGIQANKYPSKMIIHCKDLRVFQFCLTYTKEEDAKKIFRGIVHHCLEPKSLKCVFAFSYAHATSSSVKFHLTGKQTAQKTVMFDSQDDWTQEMKRTKGNCRIVTRNENFEISTKLPKYFIIPAAVTDEDLDKFPGTGLPIWCWSHHSGCALFKSSSVPISQEDGVLQTYIERMLQAVAQNHLYSVKTEDLSETLPTIQDIQQSYTKFKQFFLIDNSTDFWVSDVKWFSSLESSGWLDIIRQCLQKAVEVVECLEKENTNVLIMDEEGTDLCCVISSLVQIMLDPHYRTLIGFQGLVQKEWVAGCHAFLDRCNHLHQKDKECQSPVFLLFLECVWQLVQQHGTAFQFSETYLTVLSDSVHVPVFSTFLFNSAHQRESTMTAESQYSQRGPLTCPAVWDWLVQFDCKAQQLFLNPLYSEKLKQEKTLRKGPRGKQHQRQMSLPSSAFKTPPKKGFFKDEADSLKKLLRVKRLSRWMASPESPVAGPTSEFYEAWQRRPPDPYGLLLPCLSRPAIHLWKQRCLRWIPDSQIVGGGSVALTSKLAELLDQVQELRSDLEHRACWDIQAISPRLQPRPIALTRASVRLSSSFPFASGRSWCSKPAIPTSLLHNLMVSDKLASQDDESSEVISFV
ncbi:myotubularin-related protein 12 isoform X1 [Ictalurus furcatus]|uniref:myotubularin-related protein 12 isoform X1 n=1 Tax=Ictalurus furcatus TaxID=66913 RepID=UPI002350C4A6|nr:myotubularin-related protein 12 isoform X1 [Ictalurus furcatus]